MWFWFPGLTEERAANLELMKFLKDSIKHSSYRGGYCCPKNKELL